MPISTETAEQFAAEEDAYWRLRDDLLRQHRGKWVAIVEGKVVAVGDRMNSVAAEAYRVTGSRVKFVACVGKEDFQVRVRQVLGWFDMDYDPALPLTGLAVASPDGATEVATQALVDTGADISVLTSSTADSAGLWSFPSGWAYVGGIAGGGERRMLFDGTIGVGVHAVPVSIDCRDDLDENILGRDVINEFSLTVCAKRNQVDFEWVEADE
jgi:hypothetical protein